MKQLACYPLMTAALLTFSPLTLQAANPPPGYVDFGKFSPPAAGSEFVEVNVTSNLIAMVARLAEKSQPQVADLIRGLQGIHVNVIGLNDDNRADVEKRIQTIRGQLDAQGWQRVVLVQQAKENVGVFMKMRGEESVEGLAVTVLDGGKQAVFVNIVGDIRPEKLALIGERFHIDPLKDLGQKLEKEGK